MSIFIPLALFILLVFIELAESSLLSISKADIQAKSENGKAIIYLRNHVKSVILIVSILENLANTLLSFAVFAYIGKFTKNNLIISIITLIFSAISIYVSMLIKIFSLHRPEKTNQIVSYPLYLVCILLEPVTVIFDKITKATFGVFGIKERLPDDIEAYRRELINTIKSSHRKVKEEMEEIGMINYALEMRDVRIDQVMTHRSEFIAAEFDPSEEQMTMNLLNLSYKKRVIIWDEYQENVLGTINNKDFFAAKIRDQVENVRYFIMPPKFFINSTSVYTALQYLKSTSNKIIFVIDEFGSILGVVSITDVLKEIIGDSEDEEKEIEEINENSYKVDGICSIRTINRELNLDLPDEYITINNLIIHISQGIPSVGTEIEYEGITFVVLKSAKNRIIEVMIKVFED